MSVEEVLLWVGIGLVILSLVGYLYAYRDPKYHWWVITFSLSNSLGSESVSQFVNTEGMSLNRKLLGEAIISAGYEEVEVTISDVSYLGKMSVVEWNGG